MNKEIVVLYHAFCDDGMGAALAAYLKFGNKADYIPVEYKDPIPNVVGKEVYIFDFSYPKEILLDPSLGAKSITMLDHHISAQKAWNVTMYADIDRNISVRFDMDRSGAMLAWNYLFPDEEPPIMLKHIQDNDLWKFDMPETKFFIGNLRSYPMTLEVWTGLLEYTKDPEDYELFIREGEAQDRFFKSQISFIFKKSPLIPVTINGIDGGAINASSTFASDMGAEISAKNGTFGLIYYLEGDMVSCSLRSQKDGGCDVSELCKPFGGGGHRAAAGMKIPLKTFLLEVLCHPICQEF